jgi:predicted transcriptional regulator
MRVLGNFDCNPVDNLNLVSEWYHYLMALTLRLDPEVDAQLTALAKKLDMSKQQALSLAVSEFIGLYDSSAIARRVVDEILVRDKELLERLADA